MVLSVPSIKYIISGNLFANQAQPAPNLDKKYILFVWNGCAISNRKLAQPGDTIFKA